MKYDNLLNQCASVIETETDPVANAANLASLIYHGVEDINWVGFYFQQQQQLVLGPFHGLLACTRIAIGSGVCGVAFQSGETQLVDDVHLFPGHIACDAASESELVVPFTTDKLAGVLDIDSPVKARFDDEEKALFEAITRLYVQALSAQSE